MQISARPWLVSKVQLSTGPTYQKYRNRLLVFKNWSSVSKYLERPSQTVVYFGESRGGADRVVSLVIVVVIAFSQFSSSRL